MSGRSLLARGILAALLAVLALTGCERSAQDRPSPTPSASPIRIHGTVTDAGTGKPVAGVCVTVGRPGAMCWAKTDRNGAYAIEGAGVIEPSETEWELYFLKGSEYPPQPSGRFKLTGGSVRVDAAIRK